jgi:hypothetical protein
MAFRIAGAVALLTAVLIVPTIAHAEPLLTFEPASGPCNATVAAIGSGFPANASVQLALGQPDGDTEVAELAVVTADASGSFGTELTFPSVACDLGRSQLTVFADQAGEPDDENIYTRATYNVTAAALPSTGSGGPDVARPSVALPLMVALTGAFVAVAGLVMHRRGTS